MSASRGSSSGRLDLMPNKMAQLELLQDIPAKAGFIEGSSMKNGFQFHIEEGYMNLDFFKQKPIEGILGE